MPPTRLRRLLVFAASAIVFSWFLHGQQPPGPIRIVGTVTGIQNTQVALKDDHGQALTIDVGPATRVVRATPGQKSLADAPAIQLSDIHAGDRMLVSGGSTENGGAIIAKTIVVMSANDLARRRSQEQKDWQSGPRGVVTGVDTEKGTVTLKSGTGPSTTIQVPSSASLLRYRDGSSKFSEAQPAKIDQIKAGDQFRAKGAPDASGSFIADSVVFGTFVNVAGRIQSVDGPANTLTVNDVFTKKPVTVHITPDSQIRQLPSMIAQRIAIALQRSDSEPSDTNRPARPVDFQQVIARSPSIGLNDLHKGDAVIAVAGSASAQSPAFYLIGGVEPILTSSPGGSGAAAFLASWTLSAGGGESE